MRLIGNVTAEEMRNRLPRDLGRIGAMGYQAKKTEHAGAKYGNGALWGWKWEAKNEGSRTGRKNWQRHIREELAGGPQR